MLAGISVDTNRFAVKTGVRTFEAAAWLRKSGDRYDNFKRLFQTNLETSKKSKLYGQCGILEDGIALSICEAGM